MTEYEIEIDLGYLGEQIALVSGLVDSDDNVTLTEVNVTIAGKQINVVSMITDYHKGILGHQYFIHSHEDSMSINGKHLYDEHDYS